ncbi:MAG: hypothetical protein Q8Q50_05785 [Methylobacter sp.]|nr:hypothetical protein [Methylobacter sp.]
MKLVGVTVIGLILLYFVTAAFKIDLFNAEMLVHSGLRFFAGFLVLGIGVFYAHQIGLKFALGLLLILTMADDIWDYTRDIDSFTFRVVLHSIYMLLWGSVTGYVAMKGWLSGLDKEE